MERMESFLGAEQRTRWCAIGVVDINSFKAYNDTLGHAVGDRIIERVAKILGEQIRSEDLLALERPVARDLHARFGGDEYCFMIPDLPGPAEAERIAARFKSAVEGFDWSREERRLAERPVKVDVGVVVLRLGNVDERRGVARKLAADLIHWADQLMYSAKGERASQIYMICTRVADGELVEVPDDEAVRLHSGADADFAAYEDNGRLGS
jgi:diguanylate cyclase (GGDEF)-like protein